MPVQQLVSHVDDRGALVTIPSGEYKQTLISWSKPGVKRGGHYHHRKVEAFLVIEGQAVMRTRKKGSNVIQYHSLHAEVPKVVTIEPNVIHSIENTGLTDMILVVWCNEVFDETDPDTYVETV